MSTQLFINAHIATGMPGSTAAETAAIQDILVEDGKFISIAPNLKATLEAQGKDMASVEVVDLGGKLVCPPFCDTHLHLDYVFTARKPGAVNESGTLFEGIQRWSETKADLTVDGNASWRAVHSFARRCDRPESYLAQSSAGA